MATGAAQFLQRSKPKTTVVDAMSIMCSYKCEAQSIGDRIMFWNPSTVPAHVMPKCLHTYTDKHAQCTWWARNRAAMYGDIYYNRQG